LSFFKELIFDIFENIKIISEFSNTDNIVSNGASFQSYLLKNNEIVHQNIEKITNTNDILLMDVIPLSFGIETRGGIMNKIIYRNTKIPVVKSKMFYNTNEDFNENSNDNLLKINIYQGEKLYVKDNIYLGSLEIEINNKSQNKFEIIFDVNSDGILNVIVKNQTMKKEYFLHNINYDDIADDEEDDLFNEIMF
jgi:molecular chaperone DnaK